MSDKVTVEAMDSSKKNSPVAGPVSDEATVMMDSAAEVCHWNDREFREGDIVECDGQAYECSFGQWVKRD